MKLARFRHKGLRAFYVDGDARGVPPALAEKIGKLLFAIETANDMHQLGRFPGWRLHPLKGELRGFWSLTVSGNWRVIFFHDQKANAAIDIDLIDYH